MKKIPESKAQDLFYEMTESSNTQILQAKEKSNEISATEFLQKLEKLSFEDLIEIKGIGKVLAQNFVDYFKSEAYQTLNQKFLKLEQKDKGLTIIPQFFNLAKNNNFTNAKLHGKKVVITGSFEISRNQISQKLEAEGAKIVNTVSKNANLILVGQKAGSKLEKAKKLGLKIITDLKELQTEFNIKID